MKIEIDLKSSIGKGYKTFWNYKGIYRVVKGGRGSKKSYTTALNFIYRMMKYEGANLLVARQVSNTNRDSVYAQLKTAINRLGVAHLWKCTTSPLEMTYLPFGTKILFRGLDDPLKITSVTVEKGNLCWMWIEEAYQVMKEADFDKVDMSIRGQLPPHLFKQITITFNPWLDTHWLNERFYKGYETEEDDYLRIHKHDDYSLVMTTNYKANEFLSDTDIRLFDDMRERFPTRYRVEGLGHWGIAEGLIFDSWEILEFDKDKINGQEVYGLDFGYTQDPTALSGSIVDLNKKELYIFDEIYQTGMLNSDIYNALKMKGYDNKMITADSAEPKSIEELKRLGAKRMRVSKKGADSIMHGIQFLKQFKIYIHPRCRNAITEFKNYMWAVDNKTGKALNKPCDDYNHFIDALRYSMEELMKQNKIKSVNIRKLGL